jgi:glycine hydroxymethyltransferase
MSRLREYLDQTPREKQSSAAIAYLASLDQIETVSPQVAASIEKELHDQRRYLKMIASENYCSLPVQFAMGNFLTDKYAEGYAHHRFYAGCENVDDLEELAVNLLKELFHAEAAYVQPHSGADANMVAFWAILTHRIQTPELARLGKKSLDELSAEEMERVRQNLVNQKILGLSLNSGGHLTHGYRHNVSGKMFRSASYDVDPKTELLDLKAVAEVAKREKPAILLAGYSAYPRKLNFAKLKEIADSVGAVFMVDMAHFCGLVAGKVFTGEYDPVPYADVVTSTTHKTLRGPRGGIILCKKEYEEVVNKGCPLVLGGPLPHVIAAKAVAFKEALQPSFKTYAHQIVANSQSLANTLKRKGLRLVTDGTDNHLLVIDLTSLGLTGRQGESALLQGHITINRNSIPFDPNGPWYTSGLRVGTPALTTLGMGTQEMEEVGEIIHLILANTKPALAKSGMSKAQFETEPQALTQAQKRVARLLSGFPLYPELPFAK